MYINNLSKFVIIYLNIKNKKIIKKNIILISKIRMMIGSLFYKEHQNRLYKESIQIK